MQTWYQPSTGSTRTGMLQTRRFRPYETPRTRLNEHTNAEAGSLNLAPLFVQYVAPPPTNPSRGTTEVAANAEASQTITDENAAPLRNFHFSRIPHVTEQAFGVRRLGGLEAREPHARGASNIRKTSGGCVPGHDVGRGLRYSQPKKKHWKVSTGPVL